MAKLSESVKTDDFKTEKHVPVIECPDTVKSGELATVKVTLGKEVAHPNTTEHHIRWVELYFQPEGGNVYQLGRAEFTAHGESTKGANEGPVYTNHEACFSIKTTQAGTLMAMSYCNIHGVWESSKEIKLD
jgi:superoxide reductase